MGAIAEAIVAYAQPLIDETDGSKEQLDKAFAITQFCFNLALLPEASRDDAVNKMRTSLEMDDEEFDDFRRNLVVPMIRRHEAMFPQMHGLELPDPSPRRASPRASVRVAPPVESHPVTDRYAPCPCNSGRKYKFCCGAKGR